MTKKELENLVVATMWDVASEKMRDDYDGWGDDLPPYVESMSVKTPVPGAVAIEITLQAKTSHNRKTKLLKTLEATLEERGDVAVHYHVSVRVGTMHADWCCVPYEATNTFYDAEGYNKV